MQICVHLRLNVLPTVELSLTQAILLFALVLIATGGSLLFKYGPAAALARGFPRSVRAGFVLMVVAMIWTGWKVWHLGSADYGDFKEYILVAFGLLGLLSFKYASDFLSVRAACILYLFCANALLDAAWMRYDQPLRLLMVAPVYLGIALSLYLAYAPYRLRDFFSWLFASESRAKRVATLVAGYGALLGVVAFVA